MLRKAALATMLAALVLAGGYFSARIEAHATTAASVNRARATPPVALLPAQSATPIPTPSATPSPTPSGTPAADPRSTAQLQMEVAQLAASADSEAAVALVELGGSAPLSWSYQGDTLFVAASTYKLPLLMDEAQQLSAGGIHTTDSLCYEDGDWEDGWYDDYADGTCYPRQELASRVGQQSDNTAAHILVDSIGGGAALNAYARSHGATESAFYDPNQTTANDLARLWVAEARGQAGGSAAQQWLYPLLTHTVYESGIPAGAPAGATVVHKIGALDGEINDAALVLDGPRGPYVLVVMTDGPGGTVGWQLAASISRAVWDFEAQRS